ncbi:leucine-rich repeat protein [Mycoplasma sp. VS31B]
MEKQHKDYEIFDNKLYIFLEEIGPEDIASWKIDESKITELHSTTLKVILSKAFIAFDNLENIDLPNVVEIGQKAFSRIKALKKINLPNIYK